MYESNIRVIAINGEYVVLLCDFLFRIIRKVKGFGLYIGTTTFLLIDPTHA